MQHKFKISAQIVLGITISLVFGWLAVKNLEFNVLLSYLTKISVVSLLPAFIVFMVANYLRALRWKVLFVDQPITVNRLFIVQNEGTGLNNVLPVRVGGEIAQIAILNLRDGISKSKVIATLGVERIIDLISSISILGLTFFLAPEMHKFNQYVFGAILVIVTIIVLLRLIAWATGSFELVQKIPGLVGLLTSYRHIEKSPKRILASFVLSVGYWILIGISAWMIAASVKITITPVTATLVIMTTIFFSTIVPAAPSGLGTFEWVVVYFLTFFGVEHEAGFGFAVIIHLIFFLPSIVIAILFLPREGIMLFKTKNSSDNTVDL